MSTTLTLAEREINGYTFRLLGHVETDDYPGDTPIDDLQNAGDIVLALDRGNWYRIEGNRWRSHPSEYVGTDDGYKHVPARPRECDGGWTAATYRCRRNATIDATVIRVWRELSSFSTCNPDTHEPAADDSEADAFRKVWIQRWREHVRDIASGNLTPYVCRLELVVVEPDGTEDTDDLDSVGCGWYDGGATAAKVWSDAGLCSEGEAPTMLRDEIENWLRHRALSMSAAMKRWSEADRAIRPSL